MTATPRNSIPVEHALRAVERHVLEEVWLGTVQRATATAATTALGAAVLGHWLCALRPHGGSFLQPATVTFLVACVAALQALYVRRFRWCCVAMITSGLATVAGAGTYWWYQTAPVPTPSVWIAVSAAAAAVLTVAWLGVVLTPLEKSQPDMRMRNAVDHPSTGRNRPRHQ